jgi:uncharacterized membrane protein YdfJ with MMPL/SSD domain
MLHAGTTRGIAARVGSWSARHKKSVLAGWLAFVVLSVVLGGMVGTNKLTKADQFTGQSGKAEKTLEQRFPAPAHEEALIHSPTLDARDPAFAAAIRDVKARVSALAVVKNVKAATDPGQSGLVSSDGHSALVEFDVRGDSATAGDRVAPIEAAVKAAQRAHPDLRIEEFGDASVGSAIDRFISNDLHRAETLSLPVTLLILVIAFGAFVAAGVPVLLAISAVIATIGLVAIPSHIFPIDDNTSIVITLIGMAVGVDYSLFYLKREREERHAGRDGLTAVEIASATSGRAIVVSGLTVMAAMAGQFLTGDKSSASFGVGTIMVVAVAVLGSLTALPAMLALLGRHVDKGRIRIPFRRRRAAAGDSRVWTFVLDRALARPVISAVGAVLLLLAIASPALHMRVHTTGANDVPPNLPGITVYHHLQKAFPNSSAPAIVVVQARDTTDPAVTAAVTQLRHKAVAAGVAHEPIEMDTNAAHTVETVALPLPGDGSDDASKQAVTTLRDSLIPSTLGQVSGVTANVTGETAIDQDQTSMLEHNAPLVFAFVLGLAFLLLLVTFRSIVIPIKAIILNLLSVAAAYGVLVAVFQDGHGSSLLGFTPTGGVVPWLPLFLFVILFGLSMDYHVFILSRVKELVDGGMRTDEAVAHGIKSTAGTVTSAAVVMVGVFSIFVTLTLVDFKEFGVGLAAAVFIDATLIRGVLLPATMKLLGDWNWYLPHPLRRLPRIGAEPSLEAAGD